MKTLRFWFNPTGLHDENHYTSARDLYKIARAAMEIPELREIVGTASAQLAPTNMHPQADHDHHDEPLDLPFSQCQLLL